MGDRPLGPYDVIVMGGGPAGATLAARLTRETSLRVALFEKERFPREHIGESFASPVVPCLQESGVLDKVLASDCYVRKYGGYYSWDPADPTAAFFRHRAWQQDGYRRWSLHVNRSEFDQILLDHARDCGAEVFQGAEVTEVRPGGEALRVRLRGGGAAECRVFVDASGRGKRAVAGAGRAFLSSYRNIAVWGHFVGGRPAQSLAGAWNVFREPDLSPIGCFAFADGWCWYIPVPKVLGGRRRLTHSIGIVTDPAVLDRPGKRYTEPGPFLDGLRRAPLLRELIADVRPVSDRLLTATNYSMISARMCDYDARWLLVGDAAYFVDPLFSSGVSFALLQAAAAAVIKATLGPGLSDALKRELWDDYSALWTRVAHSFALAIDQWYAAIARGNPQSVYWRERASDRAFEARLDTFHIVLDADLNSDLLHVITRGTGRWEALEQDGALARAARRAVQREPAPGSRVRLKPGVAIKKSLTLQPAVSADSPPAAQRPAAAAHGPYWTDPRQFADEVQPLFASFHPCHRFYWENGNGASEVKFSAEGHEGFALAERLRGSPASYEQLRHELPPGQWALLLKLLLADMVLTV
jgi:flavin-dependent dehydrogenase